MITPEPTASTTLIGNAAVSLTAPAPPASVRLCAANADRAQADTPASTPARARSRPLLRIGLWLTLLLWSLGTVLLLLLNLASGRLA